MSCKIYIAGHTGLVGSALVRHFSKRSSVQLLLATHAELDLTQQKKVEVFLAQNRPDVVVVAAGKVGGIQTNAKLPAEFIYQNLMLSANVIHSSFQAGVKHLLNFGSACLYPKECPQPMTPNLLMTGKVEPTNEPYAIAKMAGLSLCSSYNRQYGTSYINAIPGNLYGPCDSFDLERCHVISALIRKFHEAKENKLQEVVLWGSGRVVRDFLFVDDLAQACSLLLDQYSSNEPINIGSGKGTTVEEISKTIAEVVGFQGAIRWDTSKPDGAPSRLLDNAAIERLGWKPKTSLREGLETTHRWFLENNFKFKGAACAF